ncbi:MAG: hypothetical protein HOV80_08005 [Polyangiaceae bacterium]|nr:hypothetical protein [Polyangiaceae bacterium]
MRESEEPGALSLILPWLALVVGPLVFIGLLGGFHPSDERRDWIVRIALVVVSLLQIPALLRIVGVRRGPTRGLGLELGGLFLRLGIAVPLILFAGSISHEQRDAEPPGALDR